MNKKNIENRIKKIILMEKYVNSFIKNKDNDLFINIFIMYVNDLNKELEIIKIKKVVKNYIGGVEKWQTLNVYPASLSINGSS